MSEISPIIEPTQIGSSSDRPHAKYDYLIARAKQVPAAQTVVVHPCDETSLRGASNFIQTAGVNGSRFVLIEPLSQGDRAFNSTYPAEPRRVSVTSLRNMSGERRRHAVT